MPGFNDRYIDLRVDDHPSPIAELRRLLDIHQLYFLPSDPAGFLPLAVLTLAEVRAALHAVGYLTNLPENVELAELGDRLVDRRRRQNSASVRSPSSVRHRRPSASIARRVSSVSTRSAGSAVIATSAPSRAYITATARPMPESPPVISATLPSSLPAGL